MMRTLPQKIRLYFALLFLVFFILFSKEKLFVLETLNFEPNDFGFEALNNEHSVSYCK